jgi:hypothetical protein
MEGLGFVRPKSSGGGARKWCGLLYIPTLSTAQREALDTAAATAADGWLRQSVARFVTSRCSLGVSFLADAALRSEFEQWWVTQDQHEEHSTASGAEVTNVLLSLGFSHTTLPTGTPVWRGLELK